MKRALLLTVLFASFAFLGFSQSDRFWAENYESKSTITTNKAVARKSFPTEFRLFNLDADAMKQQLFSIVGRQAHGHSTVITLPNADGQLERFEVFEASNFEPALQQRFPEIRAFSGKGLTDKYATLKLSISPQGIQTMVFRTDKVNEFIEAYSNDNRVYAVFKSQRNKGQLPWTCSTQDHEMFAGIAPSVAGRENGVESSAGELKTMRLAQSCNGEYSNYFGAFNASQVNLVLAAFNATMTRCNGVYEKDLALHLNLIANTADVIYYDPGTDPYTTLGQWNGQLQATLNSVIGAANYDIGHMFGASGGGGNAGCIGCVCNDANKGSGITSPADGIPQGDNFDIDYVVHEVGHQLGANHTFSHNNEGAGVNKEVGSGITIMGYAGITSHDVAPHSIDIFHEASIQQIQNNLATKTCPVTTNISAVNATPVVAPVANYTIPISTPFALTGSATDANPGDVLTYCWEQNDDGVGQTGNNSRARENKPTGPNFLSYPASSSPTRTFPILASVLNGSYTTTSFPGGDNILIEALSNVSRTLNFRLTVRDNSLYSSVAPVKVGQTAFTDMTVTVTNTSGPFAVTTPNTNVSWPGNSTQTVQWSVNNTTAAPVSCANVRILLSTDGGLTFPTVLIANTANDGSETVTIPNTPSTTARIKVESVGNIFFDISNTNFTISAAVSGFTFTAGATATTTCPSPATLNANLATTSTGGFNTPIVLTATAGVPAGTTVTFAPNPLTPGNTTVVTLNNANTLANGTYNVTVQGIAGSTTQTTTVSFVVQAGTAPTATAPANATVCAGATATFSVTTSGPAVTGYQWQVNTGSGFTNISGATSASYTTAATTAAMNGYQYRVIVTGQCGTSTSAAATLTVNTAPAITAQPTNQTACVGNNATFSVTATGTGLTYAWELSTDGGGTWAAAPGANTGATYTVTGVTLAQNNHQYRVIISGTCPSAVTSSAASLLVGNAAVITGQPSSTAVCVGSTATFTATATGSSLTYQWQVSTDNGVTWNNVTTGTGGTTLSYTTPATTATMDGYRYRLNVFSCTATPTVSNVVTLTVNSLSAINTQPSNAVLCAGGNTSFTVAAVGTGITYQWQVSTTGCAGTFTNIAGATGNTLNLTAVTASQNGYAYRVVVTNVCNTVTSTCATLTVNTPIVITTQPANASICLPTNSATFSVAVTGTAPTYQWQVSTDGGTTWTNVAGATSASVTIPNLTPAMSGNRYRVVIAGTCTTSLNSSAATLLVNSPVAITTQPVNTGVCEGSNTSFTVAATGSTITYQWQVSVNGNAFTNVSNTAPYSGATTNTLSITNATSVLNGTVYRVVVSGVPCGSVNSNSATLTVNALPGVVLVAAEYANLTPYTPSGLYSTVSPASGTYTYVWRKDGGIVAGATAASLPVNVDWFGQYDVTVTDQNGCSRTSNKVTIADSVDNLIFIYPNPSKGVFQVRYYSATPTEFSLNVYDSKGGRVWTKKYPVTARYEQMAVDLGNGAQGVYKVDVRDKNGKRLAAGNVLIHR